MSIELAPLRAMLDTIHDDLPLHRDHNAYVLGELGKHNIVIAVLPSIGNSVSGIAATQILNDFPSIRFVLLVGIGGGVPGNQKTDDVRLGDVVISQPTDTTAGVIQFDRGKRNCGAFERTGCLNKPPTYLSASVEKLKAQHEQEGNQIRKLISDMLQRNPSMYTTYNFPGQERDQLFESEYQHVGGETCQNCDITRARRREERTEDLVKVHYGTIGSSNSVIKNAMERDNLKQAYNILCVEMEAAGLMDAFPCLVIRGICDYADSHKNKQWQHFAAAAAAAYAKELLLVIPPLKQPTTPVLATSSPGPYDHAGMTYIDSPPILNDSNIVLDPRNGCTTVDKQTKYLRLLQSLTFERMDARLLNIANALPQTCRWVFKEEKFQIWIARKEVKDNHGFLWIKGKPGSGKSTIMREAVKMVKRKQSRDIVISYFFNARAPGHLEKSSAGMYRSLVHQILRSYPHLQGPFTEMFTAKDREGFIDNWTPTELQGFLMDAVESLGHCPLIVFIDALDEGDENDVRQLIAFLEELSLTAIGCGTSLRVCLSSRHYPHISIRRGLSLIIEHQDGQRDDIGMYVRHNLLGDEGHEMEKLRDKVCQKSSRVFLWVVLVIPMLNKLYDRGQIAAMETRLMEIPDSLEGLFAEILARNAEDIESTVLLLQWVLFSMQPLGPVELYLAIQSGLTSSPIEGATTLSEETLDRYLLNCSRGLTEVTKTKPPLVQFIHETVRDFLVGENGLTTIDLSLAGNVKGISHERLHTACLRYFDQCLLLDQNDHGERIPECGQAADVQRKFPFSNYTVSYLFSHADIAEGSGIRHRELLKRFQTGNSSTFLKWIRFRNTFQRYKVRKYTMKVSLLYILAEQNLANLGRVLIDDKVDIDARGERYGNALQAACVGGHEQMVKLLVQSGASIDTMSGEHGYALCAAIHGKQESIMRFLLSTGKLPPVKALEKRLFITVARGYLSGVEVLIDAGITTSCTNGRQETPLYLASARGHKQVAQLLIEKGADINAQDGFYGSALQAALKSGHEQVAQLLIEKGADVNAQGGYYGNALQAALARGHKQVAQLLIEKGVDVNAQGGYYGNALQAALANGYEQVAQLLIEKGADVNAQGGYYGNALQAASAGGHEQVIQLLIEKGANVNAQGGYYGNALQAASAGGHEQVIQLLIEKGADVNAQGGYYGNALQAALAGGHKQVAQLLIEKGVDVNAQGGYYGNALQAALARGHKQVAQLLIEKGADVNAQGGYYGNALQAALARGHKQVAQLLIEKGANVNAQGGYYGNALQAASAGGHKQVAQLLIEKGANVNAQGGYYGNALQAASAGGHKQVAQLLIEKGADVNTQGGYYGNALQAASTRGHKQVAQLLIEKGADVNAQGGYYGNALQAALAGGHKQVAQLLIEKGVDVNAQGGYYGNALHAASAGGHKQVAQLLIEKGAVREKTKNSRERPRVT